MYLYLAIRKRLKEYNELQQVILLLTTTKDHKITACASSKVLF